MTLWHSILRIYKIFLGCIKNLKTIVFFFEKVMASGGLYFYYLHQQFTVLNNNLCTFGQLSEILNTQYTLHFMA